MNVILFDDLLIFLLQNIYKLNFNYYCPHYQEHMFDVTIQKFLIGSRTYEFHTNNFLSLKICKYKR